MRRIPLITLLAVAASDGCTRTIRTGALIDKYSRAECLPVVPGRVAGPPTRTWEDVLRTDGSSVQVSGAQIPGGRISLKYLAESKEVVAADAGDYIYPADVRFDPVTELLYVKASGIPAAFGGPQTWLFEYDLRQQQQTGRAKVDPSVLPQECAVSNAPPQ